MTSPSLIQIVWFAGLLLQAGLGGVLLLSRNRGKFPAFTVFALFGFFEGVIAFAVYHYRNVYFFTYVIGESISIALGLAVVWEIFRALFRAHEGLRRLANIVFRVVVVLLILLGAAVIYSRAPFTRSDVGTALVVVEEAARVLEVGLLMFLFFFSSVFGLHWRQKVFGIALGLGIATASELIAVTVVPHVGSDAARLWNLAHMMGFNCSLVVWLSYALVSERITNELDLPKTAQLERWNRAMMELIHQ